MIFNEVTKTDPVPILDPSFLMISYAGSHPLSIFFDSEDTAQLEQVIEFLEKTTAKTYNTSKGLYDYIGNELIRRVHFMLLCHDRSKKQATS